MSEGVEITLRVTAYIRRAGRTWSAVAPRFGVASQGRDSEGAKRSLKEALELWVESCVDRGTLEQALREVGFRPTPWGSSTEGSDRVRIRHRPSESQTHEQQVLGTRTEVAISVPAYQAAAFLALSDERPGA